MLKQCGSCQHAAGFDYGPSPSGPEDGVNCTSKAMADYLDQQSGWDLSNKELQKYGHINLFRTEELGTDKDPCECDCWEAKQ